MLRRTLLQSVIAGGAALVLAQGAEAQQKTTLNVMTAGDQNMVDYITDYLGPMFEKQNPNVSVRAVGTGPGDAGSQKIWERLDAQKKAGTATWDVDVAVVHQAMAGQMVKEGLLDAYRDKISTGKLVTRDTAKNSLGANVDGFVIPMFHSQTAIAYNPAMVASPPKSLTELVSWTQANPKKFGYNGIKGGMSGVAFVFGWVYANAPNAKQLMEGPYDPGTKVSIDASLTKLKDFNKNVVITPGNAGTLDMLNRGEISMGAVWVDMFYTWQAEGRLPPTMRLQLISPGMPGQPMYYVVPTKAANSEVARKFVELATSPAVQAEGIVKRFNWYPGIDAQNLESKLDKAVWDKLFKDITPQELAQKGQPMPIGPYFKEIQEEYERIVQN
ncbi:MAG: extracellular solute-binding protein [Proteobacteria bacterium]|nr:extracellular solute-binding protein [Pseudomonadota bacterium]MBI3497954.1 extracellular solute-binding protein [Pseudomonadota bacterium]